MFAARRAVAPIVRRPAHTLPGHLTRRSFAETSKPAESKTMKNNTALQIASVGAVGFLAVYFFFLSKPEVVGATTTGEPEKAKNPKHEQVK